MAEGQTDEGFPRSHAWVPPRGARLRGGRTVWHFFPKKWGERRARGFAPWTPKTGAHGGGGLYKQGKDRVGIAARPIGWRLPRGTPHP